MLDKPLINSRNRLVIIYLIEYLPCSFDNSFALTFGRII